MTLQKGISSHLFLEEKLSVDRLEMIRDTGYDRVEIFAQPPHFDYRNKNDVTLLGAWLKDQGPFVNSIHTPFCRQYQARRYSGWLSVADKEKTGRLEAMDEVRRALELAEEFPFPFAVVHVGAPEDEFHLQLFDALYESLEVLVPFALARNVKIALENIPNEISQLEKLRHFLEEANFPHVGICFDTGHSHLLTDPAREVEIGGDRIVTTHLHDNRGSEDEHLMPFEGTISWSEVLNAFEKIEYKGCFLLELKAGIQEAASVLKSALKVYERLETGLETSAASR